MPPLSTDSSETDDISMQKPSHLKSKGKVKQDKPKKKAAPQPCGKCKGKKCQTKATSDADTGNNEVALEEATGSRPVSQDSFNFPQLVRELKAILPQFNAAAHHIMDKMDPDFDGTMTQFQLDDKPIMEAYVQMQITMAETQMAAIERNSMQCPGAIPYLEPQLSALKGWRNLYNKATLTASGSLQATMSLHMPEVHVGEAETGHSDLEMSGLYLDSELLLT